MSKPIRVLIVEDNEDDADLLVLELRRGGYAPEFVRVDTAAAMEAALTEAWDVVVSDWGMPRFSAREALAMVQRRGLDLPFIIVSGTVDEATAVEAMRAGAHDFMAKGHFVRLIPAIERELREAAGRAERREIERRLRHAQKIEVMGQLTGGIAHDFNNLLGIIVINAELLQGAVEGNPEQEELAGQILASAMHGADLTHRLLAFARQQPLSGEVVALDELLPRIVAILERTLGAGIAIKTILADRLWRARIDPSQVEDALLNLAINARDAMPGGGTLTIETANVVLDEHYAELHAEATPGDYVMLAITDTGTGMAPEVLERATEPFFTTKQPGKGTGLGLAMTYGFVRQSGGHMSIYSEVGTGTTVRLYLPRATGEVARPASSPVARMGTAAGEVILLVDDNAGLRRMTKRMLTGLGYRVHDAGDGNQALALLDAGEGIDLLFTDVGLPGGFDGYELAERARRRHPGLKVLFATGYGGEAQVARQGGDPLILKPYRGDDLAARIRAALAPSLAP
jgi:signal transduction histidine kinase